MLKLLEKPKNDLQIHYKNRYAAFSISPFTDLFNRQHGNSLHRYG